MLFGKDPRNGSPTVNPWHISSTVSRSTESVTKTYGSTRARSIFQGGGPMMLRDSHDLGTEALRKLGYLDDSWNSDLTEAVSCFWNASLNKYQLRKLGLISPYETTSGAVAKLRMALLSDGHPGYCQRGGTYTPAVVQILRGKNCCRWDVKLQLCKRFGLQCRRLLECISCQT